MRLKPCKNDFDNDLVLGIIKSNGPKVPEIRGIGSFEDEAEVSGVYLFLYSVRVEVVLTELNDLSAHNVSVFLEQKRVDTIRVRGFPGFKEKDNLFDFPRIVYRIQKFMVLKIKGPSRGWVFLDSDLESMMVSIVKGIIKPEDILFDILRVVSPVFIVIF